VNLKEGIEFKEYTVEINVLGLRNLQSAGLLPVKKPYIKFNLKSLLPADQSKAVADLQTRPGDTGENPNINTALSFTL
jgi:hypothetical protein